MTCLHARRIIDSGQLHQNLILTQPMFFDHGLAHAQLVNAVANGLNGLLHRAVLQVGQTAVGFMVTVQVLFAPEVSVVLGKTVLDDGAQIGTRLGRHTLQ